MTVEDPLAVALTVPFQHLVSDNRKHLAVRHGRTRRHILTPEYRAAKDAVEHMARRAMRGRSSFVGPVQVSFVVWMPDRRRRDMMNYGKLLSDAMRAIVYEDDDQIVEAHWRRAGVDREAPRIECSIAPCVHVP